MTILNALTRNDGTLGGPFTLHAEHFLWREVILYDRPLCDLVGLHIIRNCDKKAARSLFQHIQLFTEGITTRIQQHDTTTLCDILLCSYGYSEFPCVHFLSDSFDGLTQKVPRCVIEFLTRQWLATFDVMLEVNTKAANRIPELEEVVAHCGGTEALLIQFHFTSLFVETIELLDTLVVRDAELVAPFPDVFFIKTKDILSDEDINVLLADPVKESEKKFLFGRLTVNNSFRNCVASTEDEDMLFSRS